jgi:hypothetical protein
MVRSVKPILLRECQTTGHFFEKSGEIIEIVENRDRSHIGPSGTFGDHIVRHL